MAALHAGARELLGVGSSASLEEIRRAYRRCLLKAHPDKGGDPGSFRKIRAAWELLSSVAGKRLSTGQRLRASASAKGAAAKAATRLRPPLKRTAGPGVLEEVSEGQARRARIGASLKRLSEQRRQRFGRHPPPEPQLRRVGQPAQAPPQSVSLSEPQRPMPSAAAAVKSAEATTEQEKMSALLVRLRLCSNKLERQIFLDSLPKAVRRQLCRLLRAGREQRMQQQTQEHAGPAAAVTTESGAGLQRKQPDSVCSAGVVARSSETDHCQQPAVTTVTSGLAAATTAVTVAATACAAACAADESFEKVGAGVEKASGETDAVNSPASPALTCTIECSGSALQALAVNLRRLPRDQRREALARLPAAARAALVRFLSGGTSAS
eukprot:TRINITY_DN49131_c0_g1_i1.p1 TRINITY_DN49131_c0_g1~~TRINITY_DN49131_c0_g1_i1.p1  ORF type:complete len:381 (-),score=82.65 TRINITY_DN49131_c0_g1_i1:192-1334(-)